MSIYPIRLVGYAKEDERGVSEAFLGDNLTNPRIVRYEIVVGDTPHTTLMKFKAEQYQAAVKIQKALKPLECYIQDVWCEAYKEGRADRSQEIRDAMKVLMSDDTEG